jgi:radical SAM superfamily enzyme YgiQ (UPF0313 family)
MQMKCLAINPQWYDEHFLSFPLGLSTIVSIVRNNGHDIRVVDFDAQRCGDEDKERLLSGIHPEPDVILLTGMITNYSRIKKLAAIARKVLPNSLIVLGGSLATTSPDIVLKNIDADIFVMGEGDEKIVWLFNALKAGKDIKSVPGLKIKEGGAIYTTMRHDAYPDITKTPRPAYELFPMRQYIEFLKKAGRCFEIYTSKGCSFK